MNSNNLRKYLISMHVGFIKGQKSENKISLYSYIKILNSWWKNLVKNWKLTGHNYHWNKNQIPGSVPKKKKNVKNY